ncbi:MAG: hypothetical protein LBC77_02605 [Spirochaetaceae bacterium]|nr:hypothetical protein [Spirochaetaceae bacterium]
MRVFGCFLLLNLFILAFPGVLGAQKPPDWYLDKDKVYPPERFLSAAGEGKSRAAAEASAAGRLSFFFNAKTSVSSASKSESALSRAGKREESTQNAQVLEEARVESSEELIGLRFTTPYYNKSRKLWTALAYIDRREAREICGAKIRADAAAAEAFYREAQKEGDALRAYALYNKALPLTERSEEYIRLAQVLEPEAGGWTAEQELFQTIRGKAKAARGKLSFYVTAKGDRRGRVRRHLERVLTDAQYPVGTENSRYTVRLHIELYEEKRGEYFFASAGLRVWVERGKERVFSYSANYEPEGHRSAERAADRIFNVIEEDLSRHFLTELIA